MPKLTIVIPTHNYASYIGKCLSSIKSNDFSDFECLVIDDASTDDTAEVFNQTVGDDSRFRLLKNEENLGAGASRNRGIEAASKDSEWISFIDSDDFIEKDLFTRLFTYADENSLDVCRTTDQTVNANGERFHIGHIAETGVYGIDRIFVDVKFSSVVATVYRKSLIGDTRFTTSKKMENILFNMEIFSKCQKLGILSEPGYYVLKHYGSSTSSGFSADDVPGITEDLKGVLSRIKGCDNYKTLRSNYISALDSNKPEYEGLFISNKELYEY